MTSSEPESYHVHWHSIKECERDRDEDEERHSGHARPEPISLERTGREKDRAVWSYVRGEQRPDSDIDLLVEFEPGRKTFDAFMELSFLLEEVLQHKVELVTVESLSPYLAPHILKEVEYAPLAA